MFCLNVLYFWWAQCRSSARLTVIYSRCLSAWTFVCFLADCSCVSLLAGLSVFLDWGVSLAGWLLACFLKLRHTFQDIFATLAPAGSMRRSPAVVELFTRLFVLSGSAIGQSDGDSLLRLLQLVVAKMAEALTELWEGTINELETFFTNRSANEGDSESSTRAWEESLLKVILRTVFTVLTEIQLR